MSESIKRPSLKIGERRRKSISVSQESLVRAEPLDPAGTLPLLIRPNVPGVRLAAWAESNRAVLESHLDRHGGILFRGFDLPTVEEFQAVARAISGEPLEYKERSSPRHAVQGRVYTSTDYPPDQPIFLHNENSYQNTWPMRILFFCNVEPSAGGATPIADTRRIYQGVDPAVRDKFLEKGWMYMRNFGDGFGLPWQTVFQTEDPAQVDAYCADNGIQTEWRDGNRLRVRAVRRAAVSHPRTGEMVWFNHATFFHVSTLSESVRAALLEEFSEDELPTNTFYGDGSPIEPEALEHLRSLYHRETVRFPWRRGDLMVLDNMLAAHGREPYEGERQILVSMAEPMTWSRLAA